MIFIRWLRVDKGRARKSQTKKAKYVKSFTLYVDGREIYAQEIADALTADMTPFRGIGANTALRDAATLCLACRSSAWRRRPISGAHKL
jgi:hypothetical protein